MVVPGGPTRSRTFNYLFLQTFLSVRFDAKCLAKCLLRTSTNLTTSLSSSCYQSGWYPGVRCPNSGKANGFYFKLSTELSTRSLSFFSRVPNFFPGQIWELKSKRCLSMLEWF